MRLKVLFPLSLVVILFSVKIQSQTITLLHTNDLHSHLMPDCNSGKICIGGFSQLSNQIEIEKSDAKNPVFVVDAGDFLMGTLFQMLEVNTGFELKLMNEIGYDAVCLGNHEFDFGVNSLNTYINNGFSEDGTSILLSNIKYISNKRETGLSELYNENKISKFTVIEKGGIKVGFIGILGEVAYEYTPNLTDYKLIDPVKSTKKIVEILKDQYKVDFIVCLSHTGVFKDENGNWDMSGDIELASKVKGIDAIISGHTHTHLDTALVYNGVPIVQTGSYGSYLGKLTLDKEHPENNKYELVKISSTIQDSSEITRKIDNQLKILKKNLREETGFDYDKEIFENNFDLNCVEEQPDKSNIGPFLADALYYSANDNTDSKTDIALIAQGMIRAELKKGIHNLPDIFNVASLGTGNDGVPGYSLSRMYFTGKEMKLMLEMLQIMSKDANYYCYFSGVNIERDPEGGFFKKIKSAKLIGSDGKMETIDFSKKNKRLYSVTADTYMMANLALIKKKSLGLIKVTPKMEDGTKVINIKNTLVDEDINKPGIQELKVWGSIINYAKSFSDNDGNGIPDLPVRYK